MEGLLDYALKASALLLLFYAAYRILLEGETFYNANRFFLLTGLACSFLIPLVSIEQTIIVSAMAQTGAGPITQNTIAQTGEPGIAWRTILLILYLLVASVLGLRLCLQLFSLRRKIGMGQVVANKDGIRYVEIPGHMAPFSFFRTICYSREGYSNQEIEAILAHEKAHCRQWHSLDVVLGQLAALVLWFNPFSWAYLQGIRQNLEFLADERATMGTGSRKAYGYVLLKASGQTGDLTLVNQFYNSIIKKRIVMLHKTKSRKTKTFRMLALLPLLAIFLWSFNTRTIYVPEALASVQGFGQDKEPLTIHINKDTSDKELVKIKEALKEQGIDFSYTVVHNPKREIIGLSVSMTGENSEGNTFTSVADYSNEGKPIDPVTIVCDAPGDIIFNGNGKGVGRFISKDSHIMAWTQNENENSNTFVLSGANGHQVITRKGEFLSVDALDSLEASGNVFFERSGNAKEGQAQEDSFSFFYEDSSKGAWQYYLNGKLVDQEVVEHLDHDTIKSIEFIKGNKAAQYKVSGTKGVVLVTTY